MIPCIWNFCNWQIYKDRKQNIRITYISNYQDVGCGEMENYCLISTASIWADEKVLEIVVIHFKPNATELYA